jgi:hypothetical protein
MFRYWVALLLFFLPSTVVAQLETLDECCTTTDQDSTTFLPEPESSLIQPANLGSDSKPSFSTSRPLIADPDSLQISLSPVKPTKIKTERFHWGPALSESMEFLAIEHGFRMSTSYWARWNMQGPFIRDWLRTVTGVRFNKWDDGDPFLSNYIGHPLQGSVTGFIQIQNDPRGRSLKIGKSKEYWHSRLRATAWAAAYSAEFEIGPISEASLGNLGSYEYLENGKPTNGTGLVDFVVTPVIGLGWMLLEDSLDRFVSDKLELKYNNLGTRILRGALNPSRTMSNFLRLKKPWYRDRPNEYQVSR